MEIGERIRTIIARLINACWFLFKWGLALAAVVALVAFFVYRDKIESEIRDQVRARIAAHYSDLHVQLDNAQLVEGEGILIRDLTLSERDAVGPQSELAHFKEIFIECRTDLQDLLSGNLQVKQITVRRATLRATRRPDGTWSSARLLPLPQLGAAAVATSIQDSTLVLFDPLKNPSSTWTLRDVNVRIQPANTELTERFGGLVQHVEGSLTGEMIGLVEFDGWFDRESERWSVKGRADRLSMGPELVQVIPGDMAKHLRQIESLRGQVGINFRVSRDANRPIPYQFDLRGNLQRGRIENGQLPYPLTDVQGTFVADQQGVAVQNMSARSGRTEFLLQGRKVGYGLASPLKLDVNAERLVLDRQIAEVLPAEWRGMWNRYQTAGEVNAKCLLQFDGTRWHPEVNVDCVDVSFTHPKFPYPLEGITGTVTFNSKVFKANLNATGGSRPIGLQAEIVNPGPASVGYVVVRTTELPVDDRFLAALPVKTRALVKSFSPQGTIDCYYRARRDMPGSKWQHHNVVDLKQISLRPSYFPYSLRNVRGRIEGVDGRWTYTDLVGSNGSATVACAGHSVRASHGSDFQLQLQGNGILLDDELFNALTPEMQLMWSKVRPQGRVNLSSELKFSAAHKKLETSVFVDLGDKGIVLEPDFFRYRMQNVKGSVVFRQGRVDFTNLTGRHGNSKLSTSGFLSHRGPEDWELRLTNLAADQLRLDNELLLALPTGLRTRLAHLNFNGPLNVAGGARWVRQGGPQVPMTSDWDVTIDTIGGRVDSGLLLDEINGGIRLTGQYDGRQFNSRGWLDVDSVMYKGFQFTEVQGPFWIGDDRILLGAWAEPEQPGRPPRHIKARLYEGFVVGDARIWPGQPSKFDLNARLAEGDLARLAAETVSTSPDLSGTVDGRLKLQGTSRGAHTLAGGGSIRVRDGDVRQLPLVLSLLQILTVKAPESKPFNNSDIDFRIDGKHVLLDKVNFYGGAISLLGKGEMDFDKNIRMVFHGIVGRDRLQLPVVSDMMGMLSQQLMLIYVHGSLDSPRTTREALPGFRRGVQELQQELVEPPSGRSVMEHIKQILAKEPEKTAENPKQ